jgi:hypothetical protein
MPIGPVVFLDTAGLDDTSELGALRIGRTKRFSIGATYWCFDGTPCVGEYEDEVLQRPGAPDPRRHRRHKIDTYALRLISWSYCAGVSPGFVL